MNTKYVFLICLAFLIIAIMGLKLDIPSAYAIVPTSVSVNLWIDNFDSPTLNSRWSWVRQDPTHWSLSSNPGFLHIVTQPGGLAVGSDAKNLLLTSAPYGDYQITTLVTIAPTENFQGAAIYIYQDDDNYLKVTRRYGNGQKVTLRNEVNGVFSTDDVEVSASTVYLRISYDGDTYLGMYSLNGVTWNTLGEYNRSMTNPKIGLGSEGGSSLIEIPTDYDFFQLEDYTKYLSLPFVSKH